jgi:hypothetical protein
MANTHIQLFNGVHPTKNIAVVVGEAEANEQWLVYIPIVECGPVTHAVLYLSDNTDDLLSIDLGTVHNVCINLPCRVIIHWGDDDEDPWGRSRPKPVRPLLPEKA